MKAKKGQQQLVLTEGGLAGTVTGTSREDGAVNGALGSEIAFAAEGGERGGMDDLSRVVVG
eukprot:1740126-Rhodomonas_salina.1